MFVVADRRIRSATRATLVDARRETGGFSGTRAPDRRRVVLGNAPGARDGGRRRELAALHARAYHGFRAIKLACKSERVPVDWDGSYADLARLFTEEFTQNEEPEGLKLLDRANEAGGCLTEAKRAFRLWDPKTRLAYENFVLDDARDGDTVQVLSLIHI